jgi:hypothetical protein
MNLADAVGSDGARFQTAIIDPSLNRYVRFCFELEVTLFGVLTVLAVEGTLDVDRMYIVPLD